LCAQLTKKYVAQQDEVKTLTQESASKELRIRSLEEQLRSLQSSESKPFGFNDKAAC